MLFYNVKAELPGFDRTTPQFHISAGYKKRDTTQYSISLFYYQIFGGRNGFYGRFEEFFRMQRTLILYPRNIPEFVLSEDILSLQKVSHRWGAATDF